ncbi:hypothetical protein CDG81_09625 [Actinopolyspora erythraea]|uniref:Terminase n=1 Tax=Actinopolyspora erythraea TaxID=414996 RepID=A0A223RRJ5_9ACTN|nr:hypothetical protein CDG81_09625 [Actinopolyspora erythraea]
MLPKGAGKSPLAAAISCCELGGPVLFDGFDAHGEPVGREHPSPVVQLGAVSEEQTNNTMSLVINMLTDGRAEEVIDGLDTGISRINTAFGFLKPMTASARSKEGSRSTAAILDETHHWLANNGGHDLARVIRRNLAKMGGRSLETTNAWQPGEDSVAERTSEYLAAIESGRAAREGKLLVLHRQAPPDTDPEDEESLRNGLRSAYADADWIDLDRIVEEIYDPNNAFEDSQRYFLNQVVSASDAWMDSNEWDLVSTAEPLQEGEEITLGFDGSKSDDHTALVACRVSDGSIHLLRSWEPKRFPGQEIPRDLVDDFVAYVHETYKVKAFYADVEHYESYVDKWASTYGRRYRHKAAQRHAVAYDMRSKMKEFSLHAEKFVNAVQTEELTHTGDKLLRWYVLNAKKHPTNYGTVSLRKEGRDSQRKIDAAVCGVLAFAARQELVRTKGGSKRRKVVFH